MAAIARNFDAKIIKNTGTSLVYYFPKTSNFCSLSVFRDVIECGIREALMHFEHTDPNTYNLVLMDIRMPNTNGIQLYYRLKTINSNIKISFVSALDAAQEMISILPGIGLNDVIRKPVDIEQFLFKVKKALKRE
jgi:DNA-binding response OmpR family regulator